MAALASFVRCFFYGNVHVKRHAFDGLGLWLVGVALPFAGRALVPSVSFVAFILAGVGHILAFVVSMIWFARAALTPQQMYVRGFIDFEPEDMVRSDTSPGDDD